MNNTSDFKKLVEEQFIPFLRENNLIGGTLFSGVGDKAIVKRDKHGFYSVKYTEVKENL